MLFEGPHNEEKVPLNPKEVNKEQIKTETGKRLKALTNEINKSSDFYKQLDKSKDGEYRNYMISDMGSIKKYGDKLLTKDEFKQQVDNFTEFKTYEQYKKSILDNDKKESLENFSTKDLWERGLIEAGIYDVTGDDLVKALQKNSNSIPIKDLYEDPRFIDNTAIQEGYKNAILITFKDLHDKKLDESIIHTTINRSFNYTTKSGKNMQQAVKYDVYLRPECDNIYVLPDSQSIMTAKNTLKGNNAVNILNTPSLPIGLLNTLGGKGGTY